MLGYLKSLVANARKAPGEFERLAFDMALLPGVAMACAAIAYLLIQRSTYYALLNLERNQLTSDERWLLPLVAMGANLSLLLPAAAIGALLRRLRIKRWLAAFAVVLGGSTFWLLFDLVLYQSVGRHLATTLSFALLPQGREAAGDLGMWAWNASVWLFVSAALVVSLISSLRWLLRRALRRASNPMIWAIAGAHWLVACGIFMAGPVLQNTWRHQAIRERVHGMFVIDLRTWNPLAPAQGGASDSDLQRGLTLSYNGLFPLIFAAKPSQVEPSSAPAGSLPNILLIVTESLRYDVFTPEQMPRLTQWAKNGTIFDRHYATAPYSETAMFSLVYGRSPLVYHSTLDAKIPPGLLTELHALGYQTGFFTGHPRIWMRREEFLNEGTLDRYVHDDTGSWPDWDKKALDRAVSLANASDPSKPVFSLVLLMSTHFEYRYPEQYERHLPVADSVWPLTRISALGPAARIPHWNRYRNSVEFVDDLVADAVAKLDPARNVVIFTGDHGESIGDDGRYGHGYSFSEKITRVPFVMVGGPFAQRQLIELSSHVDLLPTLLPALSGRTPEHVHGINLLAPHAPRSQLLLAHAGVDRKMADALLLDRGLRLRLQLDLHSPRVIVQGLEDDLGRLLPSQSLTPTDETSLKAAFQAELDAIRH